MSLQYIKQVPCWIQFCFRISWRQAMNIKLFVLFNISNLTQHVLQLNPKICGMFMHKSFAREIFFNSHDKMYSRVDYTVVSLYCRVVWLFVSCLFGSYLIFYTPRKADPTLLTHCFLIESGNNILKHCTLYLFLHQTQVLFPIFNE